MSWFSGGSHQVRLIGFPATLIHGDTLILDRWIWLRRRLTSLRHGTQKLIDIGRGSGAFSLGAVRLGYAAIGVDQSEVTIGKAVERAGILRLPQAQFECMDVRRLDSRSDF